VPDQRQPGSAREPAIVHEDPRRLYLGNHVSRLEVLRIVSKKTSTRWRTKGEYATLFVWFYERAQSR
jgi:hypothetical protein